MRAKWKKKRMRRLKRKRRKMRQRSNDYLEGLIHKARSTSTVGVWPSTKRVTLVGEDVLTCGRRSTVGVWPSTKRV
ncbi:hypothetical protein F383_25768 [Gossypium arboreum]|uniref:60S ribosomal protein L41 n=1 Tax=Gossypium arboreum TaxID=29729 RepID=A0A0B0MQ51_GOSAR|nr:hypothetical protein F383_25768 [Gossypium arboreum]